MHVISFDNLNAESGPLTASSEAFKVRFLDTGIYYYKCEIYTRMRGKIEVVDGHP
jgi:plastocyanin